MSGFEPSPERRDLDVDVVVVGAGAAGLSAAVSAAEAGLHCVVLEAQPEPGGTTAWAVGSICACVIDLEPPDHPDDFLVDIEEFLDSGQSAAQPSTLRRLIAEESGATIRWLQGHGIPFTGPHLEQPPHRRARLWTAVPDGRGLIWGLSRAAAARGVPIISDARVTKLIGSAFGVHGVRATVAGKPPFEVRASRAVVLTTGDFAGSALLRSRHLSEAASRSRPVNSANVGDGLRLAEAVGGSQRAMDIAYAPQLRFVVSNHDAVHDPEAVAAACEAATNSRDVVALRRIGLEAMNRALLAPSGELFSSGAVLVSSRGDRLAPEGRAAAVAMLEDKTSFVVLDDRWRAGRQHGEVRLSSAPTIGFATLADYEEARPDLITTAGSVAQLAGALGMNAERLHAALARADLRPPLIALGPAEPVVTVTEGSLAVNDQLQVLDHAGAPIPGLHAAGAAGQGGLLLWGHGLHLSWAITSGRLVGQLVRERAETVRGGGP